MKQSSRQRFCWQVRRLVGSDVRPRGNVPSVVTAIWLWARCRIAAGSEVFCADECPPLKFAAVGGGGSGVAQKRVGHLQGESQKRRDYERLGGGAQKLRQSLVTFENDSPRVGDKWGAPDSVGTR